MSAGRTAHSPANELVSPTSRVLSCGTGVDGGARDLGGELAHVVELAGRLAARRDRTGVGPLEQGRRDGALDHVARDDDEFDAALVEGRDALAQRVLAGPLGERDRNVFGHRRGRRG